MNGTEMPLEYVLAQNLKRLRQKQKLSQENMSRYSGLAVKTYRDIEEERYMPNILVLTRMAKTLRCTLDDLLPLDEIE